MGQQERVLIGTSEGFHDLGTLHRSDLAGSEVTALATAAGHWWAIVDGRRRGRGGARRAYAVVGPSSRGHPGLRHFWHVLSGTPGLMRVPKGTPDEESGASAPESTGRSRVEGVVSIASILSGMGLRTSGRRRSWYADAARRSRQVGALHAGPVNAGGALNGGSLIGSRRAPKSSAWARFLAVRSRALSGASPQRHSIILRIEQCSYGPAFSILGGAKGPIAMAGTRNPSRLRSGNGPLPTCAVSSSQRGGGTWSKKPPSSSKFSMNTMRPHCGLAATALCTLATNSSATRMLPRW